MSKTFIFSWDITGIEAVIPVDDYDDYEKVNTWNALIDKELERNPLTSIIQHLILRARSNPQRHYEIYSVTSKEDMSADTWTKLWKESPQAMADLIRERGNKMYSDRSSERTQVIV